LTSLMCPAAGGCWWRIHAVAWAFTSSKDDTFKT
jgi:hypothetical protein